MNSPTTPPLLEISAKTRSIIPTGRLKCFNGQLFQEAEVIVHHPSEICHEGGMKTFEAGIYLLWFEVTGIFRPNRRDGPL